MENQFIIKSYESKELFCDREEELQLQLCNTVFANGNEAVAIDEVKKACEQLMRQGYPCVLQNHQCQGAIIEHDLKVDNNIKNIYKSMCFIKCPPHLFSPTYWKPTEE